MKLTLHDFLTIYLFGVCYCTTVFFSLQAASKRRADYILRQQLEDQKKAYNDLKRRMEMIQEGYVQTSDGSHRPGDIQPLSIELNPLEDNKTDIKDQVHLITKANTYYYS